MRFSSASKLAVILGLLLLARPLAATTYWIVTHDDGVADDGNCTLREAIRAAGSDAEIDLCAAGTADDEIVLANTGTYSFALGHELFEEETARVVIRGGIPELAELYVIDMGGANRFLKVGSGAQVAIRDLVLDRGNVLGTDHPSGGSIVVVSASLSMTNVTVRNSKAESGGGVDFSSVLSLASVALELQSVRFESNEVWCTVGFAQAYGGGLSVFNWASPALITLTDVEFTGNRAYASGPDTNAYGGGLFVWLAKAGVARLQRLRFSNNSILATDYGSLAGAGATAWVTDDNAGAVPSLALESSLFEGSSISGKSVVSGGIALDLNVQFGAEVHVDRLESRGGSPGSELPEVRVHSRSGIVRLSNLLLAGEAALGLEVEQDSGEIVRIGNLTSVGHADHEAALSNKGSGQVVLENSILWREGLNALTLAGTISIAEENLIDEDPLFVDPNNGNFELQTSSAAVDAGNSEYLSVASWDLQHRGRVWGSAVDLGALERGSLFGDDFESGDSGYWSLTEP